jgi:hypothetical protein
VSSRILFCAVDFDQYKTGRVVILPDNVKPTDAWLLDTLPGIFQRGLEKCICEIEFDVNMYVNNQHQ